MNTYLCFYKGKKLEVKSDTTYQAQCKAAALFKARKTYDVAVALCEKNGEQVTHKPQDLLP